MWSYVCDCVGHVNANAKGVEVVGCFSHCILTTCTISIIVCMVGRCLITQRLYIVPVHCSHWNLRYPHPRELEGYESQSQVVDLCSKKATQRLRCHRSICKLRLDLQSSNQFSMFNNCTYNPHCTGLSQTMEWCCNKISIDS